MSRKPLNFSSGMPQVSDALNGWENRITLVVRKQTVNEYGRVTTDPQPVTFKGVIQPLNPQQIMLKPEGQRAWQWLQIHAVSGTLNLNVNDQIVFNNVVYKVMNVSNFDLNGYIEYHAVNDYQP